MGTVTGMGMQKEVKEEQLQRIRERARNGRSRAMFVGLGRSSVSSRLERLDARDV